MPPRPSGDGELEEWLSADYRRHRDPLRTPVHPKHPRHASEPAPAAYGQYGALRGEVPEEDMELDIEGPDGDPMEDFRMTLPWRAVSPSRRYCEEEEHRSSTECHLQKSAPEKALVVF